MTEEEAKTKLCVHQPFKRREHNTVWYHEPKCVGSACMAWRHLYAMAFVKGERGGVVEVEDRSKVIGGYCGLSGKP